MASPDLLDADIKVGGDVETLRVGTVVMAAGLEAL